MIEENTTIIQLPYQLHITPDFSIHTDWSDCETAYELSTAFTRQIQRKKPQNPLDLSKRFYAQYLMESYDYDESENENDTTSAAPPRPSLWSKETYEWMEKQLGSGLEPLPHTINYEMECVLPLEEDHQEQYYNLSEYHKNNLQKAVEIVNWMKPGDVPKLVPFVDRIQQASSEEEANVEFIDDNPSNDKLFFIIKAKREIQPNEPLKLYRKKNAMESFLVTGRV